MEAQTAQKKHTPVANSGRKSRGRLYEGQHANVQSILHGNRVQPKFRVGQPNDKYEQEADRVAEQVMRMPVSQPRSFSSVDHPPSGNGNSHSGTIQRACAACEGEYKTAESENRSVESENLCPNCQNQEKGLIQTKPINPLIQRQENFFEEEDEALIQAKTDASITPEVTPAIDAGIQSLQGGGQPLPKSERGFFEPRIGADFSNVRVHSDSRAAGLTRSINARAFTHGHHVVFGAGEYSPNTAPGRKLLAHELTHVVQQGAGRQKSIQRHTLENDPGTAPGMSCDVATSSPAGVSLDVTFSISSSALSPADKAAVSNFVNNWHLTGVAEPVRIDGYASIDGPPSINWPLSCQRAEALAQELMSPSDGSPGIPSSSIELFAQGETNQFSAALIPNRRAQAHISSSTPTPPRCPDGIKTITADFVRLHGSTQSPAAQLANANTIYSGCCVRFVAGATPPQESQATTELWLDGDTELKWHTRCGLEPEEKAMWDGATLAHSLSSRMRVFFVATLRPTTALGYSRPPFCATGTAAPYVNHAVIPNNALSDTVAHEFGHILLNSGAHTGIDNPLDNRNLMFAPGRTASDLDTSQCATIFSNA